MMRHIGLSLVVIALLAAAASASDVVPRAAHNMLRWTPLPDLPDPLGVAGPFVGVDHDALIVAGGANFPEPVWQHDKTWHADASVLTRDPDGSYHWRTGFALDHPIAYGAVANTSRGIVCMGGDDGQTISRRCFILRWDPQTGKLTQTPLPDLPQPCAYGAATVIGDVVYLAGGQSGRTLDTAMTNLWRLDLSENAGQSGLKWQTLTGWPGPPRAFNLTIAQHNGFNRCVYVISGRRQRKGTSDVAGIIGLRDVYEYDPANNTWRRRADAPRCVMAGTSAAVGQSHIFVISGADGSLVSQAAALKLDHPGYPKRVWAYHTITNTWIDAGDSPINSVTTPATWWDGRLILASGEIKPRVRTRKVWAVTPIASTASFGAINFTVLAAYLLLMLGIGVYFARKNHSTDDYFRGGKKIVWWAAGCSIFATMLSSITYMAIPAKAYAQDDVYMIGNLTIPLVAPIAVYLALPFFRRIDATSAYEYLERRFNRGVRLFASAMFTLFHIFRMGIVMSLAALALATATPLSPAHSVLIMGLMSVIYCTLGGVEAVIWTDTIQTVVLLGGALLCFILMLVGTPGGVGEFFTTAWHAGKLHTINWSLDPTSASLAIWVVVIGGIGQNISSYTADQAVVQRYMTTPDQRRAGASIWIAALLSIPATLLFYLMGTGLFVFYQSHPQQLDPTFMTDQILPLFISRQAPVGAAGLIVAGIFAAAQSTISTSMNSTTTAVVTDFMRPFGLLKSERAYLHWARGLTLGFGLIGTLIGLLFIDPSIKSLFDWFLAVVGIFMGVLGGLFGLGVLTRRASGWPALLGAIGGAAVMFLLPLLTKINGYLYAAIGLCVCFVLGYLLSFFAPKSRRDLRGLTIHTLDNDDAPATESAS